MAYQFADCTQPNSLVMTQAHDLSLKFAMEFTQPGALRSALEDIGFALLDHQDEDEILDFSGNKIDAIPGFLWADGGMWIVQPFYDETAQMPVDPITYYGLGNFLQYVARCLEIGLL